MKITWLKGDLITHKIITLDKFINLLKSDKPTRTFMDYREMIPFLTPGSHPADLEKIPAVIFSSGYRDGCWAHYNGLVLLEYKQLPSYQEACRLKNQIIMYTQPFMSFIGSSGHSVKVILRYSLPDGTLPSGEEDAKRFHEWAYQRAVIHYQAQFQYPVTITEPLLNRTCRISFDSEAWYDPDAPVIRMEQPIESIGEKQQLPLKTDNPVSLNNVLPGMELHEKAHFLFETCLQKVLSEEGRTWKPNDEKGFIVAMSHYCFDSGIPESDTVRWLQYQRPVKSKEPVVRQTVRNVYADKKDPGRKPCLPTCMDLLMRTEEFLNRRYEFRKNEIRNEVEYREKNSFQFKFRPIIPEVLNDICLNAKQEGIDAWDKDIRRYIYSLRIETYHPVNEFFRNLPRWDGKDRIRLLADTVPTDNPDWRNLFYKWFVGMVGQLIKPNLYFSNNLVPILTGGQGKFKSTFFRQILPPVLQEYYTESFNPENKTDAEYQMAQNILIVIDEFDRLNKKYQAELKHLIQKPRVKVRLPHRKSYESFPRMASFAAAANPSDILTDPTGSRRYICVELNGMIDISRPIEYEQLYAQAVHAVYEGETYWLNQEEEQEMQERNIAFQQIPLEIQYLFSYFRLPEKNEQAARYSAVELLDKITERSGRKFSNTSARTFARMLNASGIQKIHTNSGNRYYLIEK